MAWDLRQQGEVQGGEAHADGGLCFLGTDRASEARNAHLWALRSERDVLADAHVLAPLAGGA